MKDAHGVEIILQPIGSVQTELVSWLIPQLKERMPIEVEILMNIWRLQPPLSLFDWRRMQYRADRLALWLHERYKEYVRPLKRLVVGIVDSDGYVEGLNFVFGIALPKEAVALVFNKRLLSEDGNLYKLRLLKEVLHETGHLLGLPHCTDPSCVMSFSNSVLDVDRKKAEFCGRCKNKLKNMFNTF